MMEAMQWWETEEMNLGNVFPRDARYIALFLCPDTLGLPAIQSYREFGCSLVGTSGRGAAWGGGCT